LPRGFAARNDDIKMRTYDIIYKKKNGGELSKKEIEHIVFAYNNGDIPDYQMSAFLMAVSFSSMTDDEIFYLTSAMINTGDSLNMSRYDLPSADKHSTGGVGDGTSLIIAPVAASAGVLVPMMVGRALGHTGGTLDKLEAIPGFQTNATKKEFFDYLDYENAAITGQSYDMVPVDKKMYALRDATATVESIPLICSSIMSKKIAEGAKTLVLDVKTGSGAFMKQLKDSRELAEKMVAIGKKFERNISAYITDMDTPLGNCAGNALEIKQAVEILKGNIKNDLYELSVELSGAMICKAGVSENLESAKELARNLISSGKALEKFSKIIRNQGGNAKVTDNPDAVLKQAKKKIEIKAQASGYVSLMRTREIGIAAMLCGAGREKKEDKIDYSAGIKFYKKTGDSVKEGEVIAEILHNGAKNIDQAAFIMNDAYIISDSAPQKQNLIKGILI